MPRGSVVVSSMCRLIYAHILLIVTTHYEPKPMRIIDHVDIRVLGLEVLKEIEVDFLCVGRSNGYSHQPISGQLTLKVYGYEISGEKMQALITVDRIESPDIRPTLYSGGGELEVLSFKSGLNGTVPVITVEIPSWIDDGADCWHIYLDALTEKGKQRADDYSPGDHVDPPRPEADTDQFPLLRQVSR